jgi:hypothetical protein
MNHLHFGGGLNMRGYAGYLLAEKDVNNNVVPAYKGASGFAVNAEIDFNRIVKVKNQKLKEHFRPQHLPVCRCGAIAYTNTQQTAAIARFVPMPVLVWHSPLSVGDLCKT